jgi:hypothetical protein
LMLHTIWDTGPSEIRDPVCPDSERAFASLVVRPWLFWVDMKL